MTKTFLALKAVGENMTSAWVKHPLLKTQYVLGEKIRCPHPKLPFFIITEDSFLGCPPWRPATGCESDVRGYILVAVELEDVKKEMPRFNWINEFADTYPADIQACAKDCKFTEGCGVRGAVGAQRVTPLEEWIGKGNLLEWVREREKHYGQKFIALSDLAV